MKINITKKQYKELITMISIANGIVGVLGDVIPKTDYKKRSEKMTDIENYFLQFANNFNYSKVTQEDNNEKKIILNDNFYENKILPIITDYENYAVHEILSNKLAWRDFKKKYSKKEIVEMSKKNGGYFGVEIYDYEKKYWDEFNENGFEKLETVKKESNK